jgi:hypothetical protein
MHNFDEEEYVSNDNLKVSDRVYKVKKFTVDNKKDFDDSMKIEKLVGGYEKSPARPRPQFIKQLTGSGFSDNSGK